MVQTLTKSKSFYSRPSIIQTSLIQTLDDLNYQINDAHSICGVHQIEHTSPPIENILPHLPEYSVIRVTRIDMVAKRCSDKRGSTAIQNLTNLNPHTKKEISCPSIRSLIRNFH